MSKPEDNGRGPEDLAFEALERAVTHALAHLDHLEERLIASEARSAELSEVVKRFTGDVGESDRILTRLHTLEEENVDMKRRLDQGREGVERILAKIRFLENHE